MLRDISQDPTTARTLQGAGHVEIQNISRRDFLGVSGTAFALALFPAPVQAFTRFKVGGSSITQGLREDPLLFVSLTADGLVMVIVHRSEMGKGIRTSFTMMIADELGAGGFGRKSVPGFAAEAAILNQKVGAPIKAQWTREDDIQHSIYHTTAAERLEVALDADNQVTGWRHNSVAPSLLSTFAPDSGHQFFIEHVQGHVDMPFDIPHVSIKNGPALAHTRIGWFRSVSNVHRAWAVQTFISKLATKFGQDGLDLKLLLLGADRHLQPSKQGSQRIVGTAEKTVKLTQLIPSGSKMFSDGLPKRPAGGGQCQPVKAWDLPFTDRSFPMWQAVYMSKSLMGRSRYLVCIRQLTAGSLPIRSVFAARWKVPQ